MLEQFASNTHVLHYETFHGDKDMSGQPYELGFRDNVKKGLKTARTAASLWKQQYVWGKMGKSCGLTMQEANAVFDTSVMQVAYNTKRVVDVVVFLAKNNTLTENLPSLPRQQKPKTA